MTQKPIPLNFTLGGLAIQVPDLRRTPRVRAALADFLGELAAEVRGEVNSDGQEGQGEAQPAGDPETPAG